MIKRFINITISICLFLIVNGQSNTDRIINKDGSIIYGGIKEKGSYKNDIQFKSNAESDYILLAPSNISGFYKNEIEFRSVTSNEVNGFFEILVLGEIDLYLSQLTDKVQEFIAVKGGKVSVLRQEYYVEDAREKRRMLYVRDLKLLLQDAPNIMKKVDRMPFSRSDLMSLIREYNVSKGNFSDIKYNKARIDYRWSISGQIYSAGLSFASLRRSSSLPIIDSVNPGGGITCDIIFSNRFIFSSGLRYALVDMSIDNNRDFFELKKSIIRIPAEFQILIGYSRVRPKVRLISGYNRVLNTGVSNVNISPSHTITIGAGIGFLVADQFYLDVDISNSSLGQGPPRNGNIRASWESIALSLGYYLN